MELAAKGPNCEQVTAAVTQESSATLPHQDLTEHTPRDWQRARTALGRARAPAYQSFEGELNYLLLDCSNLLLAALSKERII